MSCLEAVNICQGTDSSPSFSHGNTLPLVQRPFGMAAFAPQTKQRGNWFYHPADRTLEGIRLTHQPSPWLGDFGTLLLTPQAGEPSFTPRSGYQPEQAVLRPHKMKLTFLQSGCVLELTPTERGAVIRYAFPEGCEAQFLSLLPVQGGITVKAAERTKPRCTLIRIDTNTAKQIAQ